MRNKSLIRRVASQGRIQGLAGQDFSGQDWEGANLSNTDLTGTNFEKANLSGANITNSTLRGTILAGAILYKTDIRGVVLEDATLANSSLKETKSEDATFFNVNMSGTDFSSASLTRASFLNIDSSDINLEESDATESVWQNCTFMKIRIIKANLVNAKINTSHISNLFALGADFTGLVVYRARLNTNIFNSCKFDQCHITHTEMKNNKLEFFQ